MGRGGTFESMCESMGGLKDVHHISFDSFNIIRPLSTYAHFICALIPIQLGMASILNASLAHKAL